MLNFSMKDTLFANILQCKHNGKYININEKKKSKNIPTFVDHIVRFLDYPPIQLPTTPNNYKRIYIFNFSMMDTLSRKYNFK